MVVWVMEKVIEWVKFFGKRLSRFVVFDIGSLDRVIVLILGVLVSMRGIRLLLFSFMMFF